MCRKERRKQIEEMEKYMREAMTIDHTRKASMGFSVVKNRDKSIIPFWKPVTRLNAVFAIMGISCLLALCGQGAALRFHSDNSVVGSGVWITSKAHVPSDLAVMDKNPYVVTSFQQGGTRGRIQDYVLAV